MAKSRIGTQRTEWRRLTWCEREEQHSMTSASNWCSVGVKRIASCSKTLLTSVEWRCVSMNSVDMRLLKHSVITILLKCRVN